MLYSSYNQIMNFSKLDGSLTIEYHEYRIYKNLYIVRKNESLMKREIASSTKFQGKLIFLQRQISKFEKLDIEHKRTKSATWQKTEKKYYRLLERTEKHACIIQDGKVKQLTPSLARLLGYDPDELIDSLFVHYVDPDELPKLANIYKQRMAGEDIPSIYKTIIKHKDGRDIHVEINAGVIPYLGKAADFAIIKYLAKH